jgi:hypothetical protein
MDCCCGAGRRLSWSGMAALGPASVRRGSSGPSIGHVGASAAAARHGSQAAPLRGCAAGHPHDVLAALVAALREVPQELAQGEVQGCRCSESDMTLLRL